MSEIMDLFKNSEALPASEGNPENVVLMNIEKSTTPEIHEPLPALNEPDETIKSISSDTPLTKEPKTSKAEAGSDIDFFDAVKMNFRKNMLTDTVYSEGANYNKVVRSTLGEDYFKDKGDQEYDFTKEAIEHYDYEIQNNLKLDKEGNIIGNDDPELQIWYELSKRGFTPESFHKAVVDDSQAEYKELAKSLKIYDDGNMWGQSGMAAFLGATGSVFSDPINQASMALETGVAVALGVPGKVMQEGRAQWLKRPNVEKGISAITEHKNKLIKMGVSQDTAKNIISYIATHTQKGRKLKKVLSMVNYELKKGIWKDTPDAKIILKDLQWDRIKEGAAITAGASAFAGITEAIQQQFIKDYKEDVVKNIPGESDYDEAQQDEDILWSFGGGALFGGAFNAAFQLIGKYTNRIRKDELTEMLDLSEREVYKFMRDVSQGKPLDFGIKPEPKRPIPEPEVVIKKREEEINAYSPTNQEEFKTMEDDHLRQMEELERLRNHILNNK